MLWSWVDVVQLADRPNFVNTRTPLRASDKPEARILPASESRNLVPSFPNPLLVRGITKASMARIESLDSGEKPPEAIKGLYKHYQKLTSDSLQTDLHILDFRRGLSHGQQVAVKDVDRVLASTIDAACSHLDGFKNQEPLSSNLDVQIYEAEDLPGEHY